jgi:uncharacterized protein (TIGR03437 family)
MRIAAIFACLVYPAIALAQISLDYSVPSLNFEYPIGGPAPPPQTINVTSAIGTPVSFTVGLAISGGNFFTVSPTSGTTPLTLTVSVVTSALNAIPNPTVGERGGSNILLTNLSMGVAPPISVTATLTAAASLSASPTSINLSNAQTSQGVTVSDSSNPTAVFSATESYGNGPSGWFTVSQALAGKFTVSLSPTPPSGTAQGSVSFTETGVSSSVVVQVSFMPAATSTLTLTPRQLNFAWQIGTSAPVPQIATVTAPAGTSVTFTASSASANCGNWLAVTPPATTTPTSTGPATAIVSINTSALPPITAPTTCLGMIGTVSGSVTATAPVNLLVSPNPVLQVLPSAVEWTSSLGVPAPFLSTMQVTSSSSTAQLPFAATVTPVGGAPSFLNVSQTGSSTPSGLAVAFNSAVAAVLPQGAYTNNVMLTSTAAGNPSITLPVTLTLTNSPTVVTNPTQLDFGTYQIGQAKPSQTVTVSSTGSPLNLTATATSGNCGNWLSVSPPVASTVTLSGQNGTQITVTPNVSSLTNPSTCVGAIQMLAAGSTETMQLISVTLGPMAMGPAIQVPSDVAEFAPPLSITPTIALVPLSSTDNSTVIPYSASVTTVPIGQSWLSISAPSTGSTPGNLQVQFNPTGLATGTYTGVVTVTDNRPSSPVPTQSIPVTFTVASQVAANPNSLTFSYPLGAPNPATQTFTVSGAPNGSIITATPFTNTCGAGWFNATVNANIVTVVVNASNFNPGSATTCTGGVSVNVQGAAPNPLYIPVTMNVTAAAGLTASPTSLTFTQALGGSAPPNQALQITSGTPRLSFSASATTASGGPWLTVVPAIGTTPGTVSVGVSNGGLGVGTYTGTVSVSSSTAGSSPLTISVTLSITSSSTPLLNASPAAINLCTQPGAGPATQIITLTNSGAPISFTASAVTNNGSWLSVGPTAGTASTSPTTLTVTANPTGLSAGNYSGLVTITAAQTNSSASTLNIPVTFVVSSSSLQPLPASLTFANSIGGTTPNQTLTVLNCTSTAGAVLATPSSNMFTTTPATATFSPTSPATFSVGVNPTGLTPGQYAGSIRLLAGSLAPPMSVPMTLVVAQPGNPIVTSVLNSANFQTGAVSPGEIISIFGANIGPATPVNLTLTSTGTVSTNLGSTQVFFDGVAAPLIYVSATQINAIVPYEVNGRATTSVTVNVNGTASNSLVPRVTDTNPAIFSLTQTGYGQGAILNQDLSVNSSSNPAVKGSVIALFATGEGATSPPQATGSVTSSTGPSFPKPLAPVSAMISGLPAQILYSGEAPSLVSGVLQVNAVVPTSIPSGTQTIVITVGSNSSPSVITVSVQ